MGSGIFNANDVYIAGSGIFNADEVNEAEVDLTIESEDDE